MEEEEDDEVASPMVGNGQIEVGAAEELSASTCGAFGSSTSLGGGGGGCGGGPDSTCLALLVWVAEEEQAEESVWVESSSVDNLPMRPFFAGGCWTDPSVDAVSDLLELSKEEPILMYTAKSLKFTRKGGRTHLVLVFEKCSLVYDYGVQLLNKLIVLLAYIINILCDTSWQEIDIEFEFEAEYGAR